MKKWLSFIAVLAVATLFVGCTVNKEAVTVTPANAAESAKSESTESTESTMAESKTQNTPSSETSAKIETKPSRTTKESSKSQTTSASESQTTSVTTVVSTTDNALITKGEAKGIALNRAGVKEQDISRCEIELDYDDDFGRWEYEVSFAVGKIEYDVTINAKNGKVIELETEVD